jgi:hypothetical protein
MRKAWPQRARIAPDEHVKSDRDGALSEANACRPARGQSAGRHCGSRPDIWSRIREAVGRRVRGGEYVKRISGVAVYRRCCVYASQQNR